MILNKLKPVIIMITLLLLPINVYAEYRTEQDLNEIMKDRYSIEEVKEDYKVINVELTFYTSLSNCNGDNSGLTASGEYLNEATIAVPRKNNSTKPIYPFGTIIDIEGYGKRIVQDTGNPKYLKIKNDGTIIIDVFIKRNYGESDKEYRKRVLNMGRINTTAKVYL